jgi:A/G-specific adenine glycosylase
VTPANEAHETPVAPVPGVEQLLRAWFAHSGRDLPWRRTRDPYSILVSEVMLQQTQVDRVVPRYESWLDRWPTVDALAAASGAAVIVEWQGLGYNRRAVSLHRAAKHVAAEGWPADLTVLPGVGPYTAAAVRNFAFGEDVMPRDVNVERVERRTAHAFSPSAAQAVMDLGATTCIARIPRCGGCPLASACPSCGTRDDAARRQSRFEGSFRQRRAAILRTVASASRRGVGMELAGLEQEVVGSLARDGLVTVDGDRVRLPD